MPFQGSFENGHGDRLIFRYNTWTNFSSSSDQPIFDLHGNQVVVNTTTDSSGGQSRANRNAEIYCNTFVAANSGGVKMYYRGGVLLIYSNTWVGASGAFDSGWKVDEEDSSVRFNLLSEYPGYDMHWLWAWANTESGGPVPNSWYSGMTGVTFDPADAVFLTSVNFQWVPPSTAHPGYPEYFLAQQWQTSPPITNNNQLVYPHPLVSAETSTPAAEPVIFNVAAVVDTNSMGTITWTTDESSSSIVDYGKTTNSVSSFTNSAQAQVLNHTVTLSSSAVFGSIYYRVRSVDALGNVSASQYYVRPPGPVPGQIQAVSFGP